MGASHLLVEVVERRGPGLSSELLTHLGKAGLSGEAARKRLERTRELVRLKHVTFPNNQRFYYLPHQYRRPVFWEALERAFLGSGSVYGAALFAIRARGGRIQVDQFAALSGSPGQLRGHLAAERVLEGLLNARLVVNEDVSGSTGWLRLADDVPGRVESVQAIKARLLAEGVLLSGVSQWLRENRLVSYRSARLRGDSTAPTFGQFSWDMTGASYVAPLVGWSARTGGTPKPGFVVADVLLGETMTEPGIRSYLNKVRICRHQRTLPPFMPLLVASSFTAEASHEASQAQIVWTTPRRFLGVEVAEALQELIAALTRAAETASGDLDQLATLVATLTKIEGAAINLRGALFELLVAHCLSRGESVVPQLSKVVRDPDTDGAAEIDVFGARDSQRVWALECRGYSPDREIDLSMIRTWLENRVPRIRAWLAEHPDHRGARATFGFWTTSRFSDEADAYLTNARARCKAYEIDWKDGDAVLAYAQQVKAQRAVDLLRDHFERHPLEVAYTRGIRQRDNAARETGARPLAPAVFGWSNETRWKA